MAEAEAVSTWRPMLLFPELFLKIESELIFTIVILQFKTGVRMPLSSQIKELGAILQKTDKFEPVLIQTNKNDKHLASMAMRMPSDLRSSGLGSVQRRKRKIGNECSHKNWK